MLLRALVTLPLFVCLLILECPFAWAAEVNRTIDDTRGDSVTGRLPVYVPLAGGVWKDQTCKDCRINPDVARVFEHTHTSATRNPGRPKVSLTLEFTGTAIYVFFILANDAGPGITANTDCNFILDNDPPFHFIHNPDMSTKEIRYNQLVYSRKGLPFGDHRLEISTDGDVSSYIDFDYAIYTFDDPSTSTTTTTTSTPPPTSTSSASSTSPTTSTTTQTNAPLTTTKYLEGAPQTGNDPQVTDPSSAGRSANSNDSTGATSKGTPTAAIVGGITGGIAFLLILLIIIICIRRRRREKMLLNAAAVMDYGPTTQHHVYGRQMEQTPDYYAQGRSALMYGSTNALAPASTHAAASISTEGLMSVSNPHRQSQQSSSMYTDASYSNAYGGMAAVSDVQEYGHNPPPFAGSSTFTGDTKSAHLYTTNQQGGESVVLAPGPAPSTSQDEVRRARQAEIRQRLHEIEQEMGELNQGIQRRMTLRQNRPTPSQEAYGNPFMPETSAAGAGVNADLDVVEQMKEQMLRMQQEIDFLRENQGSEWARGLTHEPPPGYTPSTRAGLY